MMFHRRAAGAAWRLEGAPVTTAVLTIEEAATAVLEADGPLSFVELVTEMAVPPRLVQAAVHELIEAGAVSAEDDPVSGQVVYRSTGRFPHRGSTDALELRPPRRSQRRPADVTDEAVDVRRQRSDRKLLDFSPESAR